MAEYVDINTAIIPMNEFEQRSYHSPADVQPVRRGKWIKDSDGLDVCSECEEIALQRVFIKLPEKLVDLKMVRSNYCPNCGADMRGENDGKIH